MQDKLERARVHLDLWKQRIHNLSSNLAILPTEIVQAILIAGMTPDDTNARYLRAITQTSRQLRDAALGCSDLWVNLSLTWGEWQFRVWRNHLQGRPAELHVTPSLLRRWVFHFGDLRRLELSTLPVETFHFRRRGERAGDYGHYWPELHVFRDIIPQVTDVRRLRIIDTEGFYGQKTPPIFPKVHDLTIITARFSPDVFLGNWHLRHLKVSYSKSTSFALLRPLLVEQSISLESLQLSGPPHPIDHRIKGIDFPNLSHLVLVGICSSNGYGVLTMFRAPNLVHAKLVSRDAKSHFSKHLSADTFFCNSQKLTKIELDGPAAFMMTILTFMRSIPLAALSHLILTTGSNNQVKCLMDFVLSRQIPIHYLKCLTPEDEEVSSRVNSKLNSLFTFAEVQSHVLSFSCERGSLLP